MGVRFESDDEIKQAIRKCFMSVYENNGGAEYDGKFEIICGNRALHGTCEPHSKGAPHYACIELRQSSPMVMMRADTRTTLTIMITGAELDADDVVDWFSRLLTHGETAPAPRPDIHPGPTDRQCRETAGYRDVGGRMKKRRTQP
jgi:hypothetical protein